MNRSTIIAFGLFFISLLANSQNSTDFSVKLRKDKGLSLLGSVNLDEVSDPWSASVIPLDEAPEHLSDVESKKKLLMTQKLDLLKNMSTAKKVQSPNSFGAAASPVLKISFQAYASTSIPNDNTMAISDSGLIVSMTNQTMQVRTTTGALKAAKSLKSFCSALGNFTFISDPRVIYDPTTDRFISVFFNGDSSKTSKIIIGFSKTNKPTGVWNFYGLSGNYKNDSTWSDYPIVTITNNDLFITFNQLVDGNPDWRKAFRYSIVWQINKLEGLAGNPTISTNYWSDIKYKNKPIWNICPVQGGSGPAGPEMYFVSLRPSDLDNDTLFLHKIDNTVASGVAAFSSQQLTTNFNYGLPPNAKQKGSDWLSTNDARVLSAFIENGKIHYVHNTIDQVSLNSAVYHGVITNLTSTPVVSGSIIRSDTICFAYPSIAYAGGSQFDDGLMITCSYLPANGFAGTCIFYVDNNGSVSDMLEVQKGAGLMNALYKPKVDSLERWGDYTGIQRDYKKPGTVWLSGSFANGVKTQPLYWTVMAKVTRTDTTLIGVKEETPAMTQVDVYPNPSTDFTVVKFEMEKTATTRFALYDLNGKLVDVLLEEPVKSGLNIFSFDTSRLVNGLYLLKITDGVRNIAARKIVVKH